MTVPELGTIRAAVPPAVVLTSNRTRDLHDALKRRCLYHWIDYPRAGARGRDRPPPRAGQRRRALAGGRRRRARRGCARPTCRSRRGSRRGSTGSRRSSCSAPSGSTPTPADRTLGSVLKYREDQETVRAPGSSARRGRRVTLRGSTSSAPIDAEPRPRRRRAGVAPTRRSPPWRSGGRCATAGLPVTPDRSRDVRAARRAARRRATATRLYWAARLRVRHARATSSRPSTRCSPRWSTASPTPPATGAAIRPRRGRRARRAAARRARRRAAPRRASAVRARAGDAPPTATVAAGVSASAAERLADARLDELDERELALVGALIAPARRSPRRRAARGARATSRRGEHLDVRATLRRSRRTAGDPVEQLHRRRRAAPAAARRAARRLRLDGALRPRVPAAARGRRARRARRDVRVRHAPHARHPGAARGPGAARRSSARAPPRPTGRAARGSARRCARSTTATAAAAWPATRSSSCSPTAGSAATRRCSGARWSGSSRLAYRIVWVNPRVAAPGFAPATGGMARGAAARRRAGQRPQPRGARRRGRGDRATAIR